MSGEAGSGTASVPRWNGKREKPQNLSPRDIAAVKWKKHLRKSGKSASRDSIKSKVLGKGGMGVRGKGGETFLQKGFPSLPPIFSYCILLICEP